MKIIKSLEKSGLLIKDVTKRLKMKQKNKKEDFLELDFLGASLLGNLLTGKDRGIGTIKAGEDTVRAG